jgi:hypothetical protein
VPGSLSPQEKTDLTGKSHRVSSIQMIVRVVIFPMTRGHRVHKALVDQNLLQKDHAKQERMPQ